MALPHRVLASWFTQLAQQLDAGMTASAALHLAGGAAAAASRTMAATIECGGSFDDALRAAGRWLPRADLLTMSAAARIGRLPATLRNLAERHARLHAVTRRLMLACAYPMFVVHLGALLLPLGWMIDWEKGFQWHAITYARDVALLLIPAWTALIGIVLAARRWPGAAFSAGLVLPAVGRYLREQSLADLAFALSGFVASGVTVGDAWAAAATLTRWPRLRRASLAMHAAAAGGSPPGAFLTNWPVFPVDFAIRYRTAEQTGQLDRTLIDLSIEAQQRAERALTAATLLYPALLFLAVAGAVVYGVLTFYSGYLKMVMKLAE